MALRKSSSSTTSEAPAPAPCIAEEARARFFSQLENAYWNPALVIRESANGDRGVIALRDIPTGEPLVILDEHHNFGGARARTISKLPLDGLEDGACVAAVLYQYFIGETLAIPPGYEHYLAVLPTAQWYAANHHPFRLFLNTPDEQLEPLEDLLPILKQFRLLRQWRQSVGSPLTLGSPEDAELLRAALIVATRCWATAGLVPFIDFFNHSPDGSLLSGPGHQIKSTHFYSQGDEVNTSYGSKDSVALLSVYGYIPEKLTTGLPRGSISRFAIALDPDLEQHAQSIRDQLFLLEGDLSNLASLVQEARLTVIDAADATTIGNLASEFRNLINISNEHRALKFALEQIRGRINYINDAAERYSALAQDDVLKPWLTLLDGQKACLLEAQQRICNWWGDLL